MPGGITFQSVRRKLLAGGVLAALTAAVLAANTARVAETPAAGAGSQLSALGPGALGSLRFELSKLGTGKPELDKDLAQRALLSSPLSADPFIGFAFLGLRDNPKGTIGNEDKMLLEALRRDPRSRTARVLRLRQLAASGELKPAFQELAILQRLNPQLVDVVMSSIAQRIATPLNVDQALDAISGHDSLYLPLVASMGGKEKTPEVVVRLAERLPARVLDDPDTRKNLIKHLVAVGAFSQARTVWSRGMAAGGGLVHSPDFSDARAPAPFNWLLSVNTTGAAERSKDGGIYVSYYDRQPGALVSQLLTLAPGSYRATAEFDVISGGADNVRLRVSCHGQTGYLAEIPLRQGSRSVALPFAVPAQGCNGQILALFGAASQKRGEMQVSVRRIDVVPAGGQQ